MDEKQLIRNSAAYKIIRNEKIKGSLSHAYLIVCQDEKYLRVYLKEFAKLIMSCGNATKDERTFKLIDSEKYTDCIIYPEAGKNIVVATIEELSQESLVKPLESSEKLFILSDCQNMNAQAQNKLLKTLEEPPENVHIIMGATNEYSLLPTVKSRVKQLNIPPFSLSDVLSILDYKFGSSKKNISVAAACAGILSRAEDMLSNDNFLKIKELAFSLSEKMLSVKDIPDFSFLINSCGNINEFLTILKIVFRDILMIKSNKSALIAFSEDSERLKNISVNFDTGAAINACEKISLAEKKLNFNSNVAMVVEELLFDIMEGKYKWRKL